MIGDMIHGHHKRERRDRCGQHGWKVNLSEVINE
jgi:hypothetical protein